MTVNLTHAAKMAVNRKSSGMGLTKRMLNGTIPRVPKTTAVRFKGNKSMVVTETENRELPASVAGLPKESIKLFTKYKANTNERLSLSMAKDGRFVARIRGGWDMAWNWPHSLPEKQKVTLSGSDAWLMPATDTFALAVILAWDADQIEYADSATETKMALLLAQLELGNKIAKINAAYKLQNIVPNHDLYFNAELPLTPYQEVAAYCAKHSEGYALAMKQGTGKTPVIINVICNDCEDVAKEHGRMHRSLIVVPNAVRLNWQVEIKRFATHKIRTTVIRGDHLTRIKQLCDAFRPGDEIATVVIVGYDTLAASWPVFECFTWDLCALDESHSIKNHATRRAKVCMQLRDKCKKRIIASGTMVANSLSDLYTQLEFLGKGYSGFSSFKSFSRFYNKIGFDPQHGEYLDGDNLKRLPILQERMARLGFTISLEEALPSLPKKVYDVTEVDMTAEQAELYAKVMKEVQFEIQHTLEQSENKTLAINNVLTMLLRLSQVTSGFLNFPQLRDEYGEITQQAHTMVLNKNPKLDMLVELMKDKKPHDKTLIWACYTHDILAIEKALKDAGIDGVAYYGDVSENDREIAVQRYNGDKNCKFLVGNAAAGGVGLNLLGYPPHTKDPDTYTTHVIYFSQGWSYIHRDQSEARGHRRGTITNVRITDLVIPKTIDEEIRAAVMDKKQLALTVADLKPILSRILQ